MVSEHAAGTRRRPGLMRRAWRRARHSKFAAPLLLLLLKVKTAVLLLSKVKFLLTGSSILISVAAYGVAWGWAFAIGFVVLLFCHELGHVIQARREGLKASAPVFIPFLGAAIFAKLLDGKPIAEARVGLAGPVLGTLSAAVMLLIAVLVHSAFLQALAFTGFLLNLFNLIPVLPLDGGRAMSVLSPAFWAVGLAILIGVMIFKFSWLLVLIVILGGLEAFGRFARSHDLRHRHKTARKTLAPAWRRTRRLKLTSLPSGDRAVELLLPAGARVTSEPLDFLYLDGLGAVNGDTSRESLVISLHTVDRAGSARNLGASRAQERQLARLRHRHGCEGPVPSTRQRLAVAATYLALVGALIAGCLYAYQPRSLDSPRPAKVITGTFTLLRPAPAWASPSSARESAVHQPDGGIFSP